MSLVLFYGVMHRPIPELKAKPIKMLITLRQLTLHLHLWADLGWFYLGFLALQWYGRDIYSTETYFKLWILIFSQTTDMCCDPSVAPDSSSEPQLSASHTVTWINNWYSAASVSLPSTARTNLLSVKPWRRQKKFVLALLSHFKLHSLRFQCVISVNVSWEKALNMWVENINRKHVPTDKNVFVLESIETLEN